MTVILKETNLSFFDLPKIKFNELLEIKSECLGFLGVPSDDGGSFPGCRFGPELIREFTNDNYKINNENFVFDIAKINKILSKTLAYDLGNIFNSNYHSLHTEIHDFSSNLPNHIIPFMVGGDHSYTYSMLRGLMSKHKKLTLIHIDQHLDFEVPTEIGKLSPLSHGNFISWLKYEFPNLEIIQLGIFPYEISQVKNKTIIINYFNNISIRLTALDLITLSFEEIKQYLPMGQNVYVSFDVDVICSNFITSTGYMSNVGVPINIILFLINEIFSNNKVIGIDFMEFGNHHLKPKDRELYIITLLILRMLSFF